MVPSERLEPLGNRDALPDKERAALAIGDIAVIGAQEAGALRDEQDVAGRRVIDIGAGAGGDRAGEVGVDGGFQGCGG
jgi:hypothetical protein